MVAHHQSAVEQFIVMTPNRSSSWRANMMLIGAFGLVPMGIAIAFAFLGVWMILPFAGLELLGLFVASHVVCSRLAQQQVLTFKDDRVILESGKQFPEKTWSWRKKEIRFQIGRPRHPWDPFRLNIISPSEKIPVAAFLNREDSQQLLDSLALHGIDCSRA